MIDDLRQAALQGSASAPFLISYLQLCQASYADPADIPGLMSRVQPLGQGSWSCGWGPAVDEDDANLAYVAVYTDAPTGLPVVAAVVIRGTDVDIGDTWGIVKQAFEDLYVPWQSRLPWMIGGNVRVADGTLDALDTIAGLTFNGTPLTDYLTGYLADPANRNPLLAVTGHSLGGCLTTVVAPWLSTILAAAQLTTPIVPVTFAAPSAGNAAFSAYFAETFGYGVRAYNSLDIVPMAWAGLDGIPTAYDGCPIAAPDAVRLGVDMFKAAMDATGAAYAQPATNQMPLGGSCQPTRKPDDWYEEALLQHATATYMTLLGGTTLFDETGRAAPTAAAALARRSRARYRRADTLQRPHLARSLMR